MCGEKVVDVDEELECDGQLTAITKGAAGGWDLSRRQERIRLDVHHRAAWRRICTAVRRGGTKHASQAASRREVRDNQSSGFSDISAGHGWEEQHQQGSRQDDSAESAVDQEVGSLQRGLVDEREAGRRPRLLGRLH